MRYRTRTYIAGDWTGDRDLIDRIYQWNDSDKWALEFADAHELTRARDTSLSCTIKRSLSERLNASKVFVLIVGKQTEKLTNGGCQYCDSYNSCTHYCARGHYVDYRSYIEYECEKAKNDGMKIVVIYNYTFVDRSKCPEVLRNLGKHLNGYYLGNDGQYYWNYKEIKSAIME